MYLPEKMRDFAIRPRNVLNKSLTLHLFVFMYLTKKVNWDKDEGTRRN